MSFGQKKIGPVPKGPEEEEDKPIDKTSEIPSLEDEDGDPDPFGDILAGLLAKILGGPPMEELKPGPGEMIVPCTNCGNKHCIGARIVKV